MSKRNSCLIPKIIIVPLFLFLLFGSALADQTTKVDNGSNPKTSSDTERHEVVIVGGGLAGLTAAYFLKDRDIVLLEKADHFGGRIRSGSFGGFNYPEGPSYIGPPQGPIEKMVNDLALEPLEIPEPSEGFYYRGEFYFGSKGIADLLKKYSSEDEYKRFVSNVRELGKVYEDAVVSELPAELAELDRISARQWFENGKFPPIFTEIYDSQARGLFGVGLEKISALSFIPEIGFQFEAATEETTDIEKESGAFTFENGLSELPEAIARKLGAKAKLECLVTSVKQSGEIYEIQYMDRSGNEHTIEARTVIVAVPAPEALQIAGSVLSEEKKKIIEGIRYAGLITVALFSDSPIFDKSFNLGVGDGFIFTDLYDSSWVSRAYNSDRNKVPERALCAYIPDNENDKNINQLPDQELLERVIQGVEKIFPGCRSLIKGHKIRRVEQAFPIMPPGAYERLAKLNDLNEGRMLLAGDYLTYPTVEASAESGYLAAERLNSELGRSQTPTDNPASVR